MFMPSVQSLMNALGKDKSVFDRNEAIRIPTSLLRLLLQVALATADFDEEAYLAENPDVADAIAKGKIESARLHYIGYGYFEGRKGAGPAIDAQWYLSKYPDVAAAVREGRIESAEAHFVLIGGGEGRSPAPGYEAEASQWKSAIKGL